MYLKVPPRSHTFHFWGRGRFLQQWGGACCPCEGSALLPPLWPSWPAHLEKPLRYWQAGAGRKTSLSPWPPASHQPRCWGSCAFALLPSSRSNLFGHGALPPSPSASLFLIFERLLLLRWGLRNLALKSDIGASDFFNHPHPGILDERLLFSTRGASLRGIRSASDREASGGEVTHSFYLFWWWLRSGPNNLGPHSVELSVHMLSERAELFTEVKSFSRVTSLTAPCRGPLLNLGLKGAQALLNAFAEIVHLLKQSSLEVHAGLFVPVLDHAKHTPREAGHVGGATRLWVDDPPLSPALGTEKLLFLWPIFSLLGSDRVSSLKVWVDGTIDNVISLWLPREMAHFLSLRCTSSNRRPGFKPLHWLLRGSLDDGMAAHLWWRRPCPRRYSHPLWWEHRLYFYHLHETFHIFEFLSGPHP